MVGITKQEILSNNRMIAEFMCRGFPMSHINDYKGAPDEAIPKTKYHTSFSELIPVCNKILKLVREDRELYQKIMLDKNAFPAYYAWKELFSVSDIDGLLHIESIYLRVTDFLKWWNQNK
jgi:hypothetical protein